VGHSSGPEPGAKSFLEVADTAWHRLRFFRANPLSSIGEALPVIAEKLVGRGADAS